jgi:hypothetical protein
VGRDYKAERSADYNLIGVAKAMTYVGPRLWSCNVNMPVC